MTDHKKLFCTRDLDITCLAEEPEGKLTHPGSISDYIFPNTTRYITALSRKYLGFPRGGAFFIELPSSVSYLGNRDAAELRGTARIGLDALFPTQGPMQLIPTATDSIEMFFNFPGKIYTLSMLYIQRDFSMSGNKMGRGCGLRGGGVGGDSVYKFIF
jgi:hypothetical protein